MGATVPAVSEGLGAYSTVKDGPFTVSSNSGTAEEITESLQTSESGDQGHVQAKDNEGEDADGQSARPAPTATAESPERGPDGRFLPKEGAETASEGKDVKEAAKPEKPLGKPRDDPRARVEQATRETAQLKRENAELQARLRENERQRSAPPPVPQMQAAPQPQAQADVAPKADKFNTWDEYQEAREAWVLREAERKATAAVEAREYQRQQAAQGRERIAKTHERLAAAAKADPEFENKTVAIAQRLTPHTMLPPGSQISGENLIATEMLDSEHLPALLLHFSEHPDDFQRIAALRTGRDIARAVAKLETRFEQAGGAAPQATAPKAVSKAQPPVRPVAGGPNSADDEDDEDGMSIEALIKQDRKSRAKRR